MIKRLLFTLTVLLFCSSVEAVTIIRPIAHGAAGIGAWTDDGGGTTDIWQALDDNSTADYIEDLNANNTTGEFKLGTATDPGIHTDHILRFEIQGTGGGAPERCSINLLQGTGGSTIASIANQSSRGAWSGAIEYTLLEAEAANITDYTDLHVTIISSNLSGSDDMWCAWAEVSVPDAPPPATVAINPQMRKDMPKPSWKQGFARSGSECDPQYANRWRGKIGHWCPALGPTGNTLFDVSGHGNHGAFSAIGLFWTTFEGMPALDFDGSDGEVDLGSQIMDFQGTNNFSVIALVEIRDTSANYFFGTGTAPGWRFGVDSSGGVLAIEVDDGVTSADARGTEVINDDAGSLYSMGFSWDGTNLLGYLDGNLEASASVTVTGDILQNVKLGVIDFWANMRLLDARIYDIALPAIAFKQHYEDPFADLRLARQGALPSIVAEILTFIQKTIWYW